MKDDVPTTLPCRESRIRYLRVVSEASYDGTQAVYFMVMAMRRSMPDFRCWCRWWTRKTGIEGQAKLEENKDAAVIPMITCFIEHVPHLRQHANRGTTSSTFPVKTILDNRMKKLVGLHVHCELFTSLLATRRVRLSYTAQSSFQHVYSHHVLMHPSYTLVAPHRINCYYSETVALGQMSRLRGPTSLALTCDRLSQP